MGKGFSEGAEMEEKRESIREVFEELIQRSGKNLNEIAAACQIPYQTLYNIRTRNTQRTDLHTLKSLADYFDEDISIFLGLKEYHRPLCLSAREIALLENYRMLSDAAQDRVDASLTDMLANRINLRNSLREGLEGLFTSKEENDTTVDEKSHTAGADMGPY